MERIKSWLNPIKGITFDLEGTIIDLEKYHHDAHLKAAESVGVNLSWQKAFECLPHFIGGPDEKVAEEIALIAKNNITVEEIIQTKQYYFNEILLQINQILPREGFIEFINWVKIQGIKTTVGSVTNNKQVIYLLTRANLLEEFNEDLIISREDVTFPKPNPEVYFKTAERIGISPLNQLVFEDSLVGLQSALNAGSRTIAIPTFNNPSYIKSLYDEGAEIVIKSWTDERLKSFILNSMF